MITDYIILILFLIFVFVTILCPVINDMFGIRFRWESAKLKDHFKRLRYVYLILFIIIFMILITNWRFLNFLIGVFG